MNTHYISRRHDQIIQESRFVIPKGSAILRGCQACFILAISQYEEVIHGLQQRVIMTCILYKIIGANAELISSRYINMCIIITQSQ